MSEETPVETPVAAESPAPEAAAPAAEAPPAEAAPAEAAPAEAAAAPAPEPAAAAPEASEPARSPSGGGAGAAPRASVSGGLGGGGFTCTICSKISFPAETIVFETKHFHAECFRCKICSKKMDGGSQAAGYEGSIYCRQCFEREGFHLKQRQVKWTPKASATPSKTASRFGGGGTQCTVCGKTSYAGETVQFEMKPYHNTCFKCTECTKDLKASETGAFEGKLYCTRCFEKNNFHRKQAEVKWTRKEEGAARSGPSFGGGGTPCVVCNLTVFPGEALQYDLKVYHQKCFKCTECKNEVKQADAAKFEEKVYCARCFAAGGYARKQASVKWTPKTSSSAAPSRFGGGGAKCTVCAKTVYPAETIQYESKPYHSKCFCCSKCTKELAISAAEYHGATGRIYCKKCFVEDGLHMARVTAPRAAAAGAGEAPSS